jgi:hypothetical protein
MDGTESLWTRQTHGQEQDLGYKKRLIKPACAGSIRTRRQSDWQLVGTRHSSWRMILPVPCDFPSRQRRHLRSVRSSVPICSPPNGHPLGVSLNFVKLWRLSSQRWSRSMYCRGCHLAGHSVSVTLWHPEKPLPSYHEQSLQPRNCKDRLFSLLKL